MPKSTTPPPDLLLTPIPSSDDLREMDESIRKISAAVNKSARHTERIPEIQRKVEGTSSKVIELGVKLENIGERVTKAETKIDQGHDCVQVDVIGEIREVQKDTTKKIEIDAREGIEHRARIDRLSSISDSIETDVEEIKKAPRKLFTALIGILITVLSGIGGGIWFLAELNKDVEFERARREEQYKGIEKQLTGIGVKVDPAPISSDIKRLEDTVKASSKSAKEFNNLCDNMNYSEKRVIRVTLHKRDKKIPMSCLE